MKTPTHILCLVIICLLPGMISISLTDFQMISVCWPGINAGNEKTVSVLLDFVKQGDYKVRLYTDDADGKDPDNFCNPSNPQWRIWSGIL